MPDETAVQGQPIPIPQSAIPKKGIWQKFKDWYSGKPQKVKDFYNTTYDGAFQDVSPELRGFSKAALTFVGIPALVIAAYFGLDPATFQRHDPRREIDFKPLARSEVFRKDGQYAVRYFGRPDKDYTFDDEDTLDQAIRFAENKAAIRLSCRKTVSTADRMTQEKCVLDDIAGIDQHVSRDELSKARGVNYRITE